MPDRNEAVIVGTARSPIGRANKGSLVDVRADELMATILNALMDKVPQVGKDQVVDIICGNVAQSGETGFSIARTAGLLAKFPNTVPGLTINRFCASSLQSVRSAAHAIAAGEGEIFIAAGVEKSSVPPAPEGDNGAARRGGGIGPGGLNPKLLGREGFPFVYIPMGMTAENVAERFSVSREDQDAFAKLSQDRAVAAQAAGFFEREITPITKEDGTVVSQDDCPRPGTTLEALANLKAVFKPEGGTVTAGNSCPLNDGAAAVMVMSRAKADELGIKPLARIVASAVSGNEPEIMGVAPIDAIPKALARAGMKINDVDVVELNEAFAAQVLPVCRETGVDIQTQLNPHGGAIALGHPFGMTGARIMTTLINDLQTLDKSIGLETMCAAGGMAMAMIIERLA
ncbi:MAG TPA: acetyl-CoA C-acyltransferase [Acidimicrobiales bacterium]|nr:acetyl-CoA C-acyltransferase [Acidimicrobiales bacterium]